MQPEDRDAAHLWDMLQAARDAAGIVSKVISRESFVGDRMRMLALERSLELVGEAARRVSDALPRSTRGFPGRR